MVVTAEQLTQVKLRRVVEAFGGQSGVARLLRVHRSQISRWLAGEEPDPRNKARLEALEFVLARLCQTFAPATARKWLTATNAHLGDRRPLDLLARNRLAEVIAAIEQADLDSYA
jgi:DNA-binding transcriptional regulator YdaS (Cro superfamily)